MKRKRLCDAVCRAFWEHPDAGELNFDVLRTHPILFDINHYANSNRSGSQIMSILSRTPGPLVKTSRTIFDVSGAIVVRPPWPTADRDAIVLSRAAIKSEADFRILKSLRGSLIALGFCRLLYTWETRQLAWMESACEAWVEKTCPRRYREVEIPQ